MVWFNFELPLMAHPFRDPDHKPVRCGAINKSFAKRLANGKRPGSIRCMNWVIPGKTRCRLHGGLSTAKTPEGKGRQIAAMVAGRRLWLERPRAEGLKPPSGWKRPDRHGKWIGEKSEPGQKEDSGEMIK